MGITDTENIFFIFARNTPKNKHKIMILPFVSPVLLPLLLLSPGWLLLILSSKEVKYYFVLNAIIIIKPWYNSDLIFSGRTTKSRNQKQQSQHKILHREQPT